MSYEFIVLSVQFGRVLIATLAMEVSITYLQTQALVNLCRLRYSGGSGAWASAWRRSICRLAWLVRVLADAARQSTAAADRKLS